MPDDPNIMEFTIKLINYWSRNYYLILIIFCKIIKDS